MRMSLKLKEPKWRRKSCSLKTGVFRALRRKILHSIGLWALPSVLCYSLSWPIISQPPNTLYKSSTTQPLSRSSCWHSALVWPFAFLSSLWFAPFISLPWSPQLIVAPPSCSQTVRGTSGVNFELPLSSLCWTLCFNPHRSCWSTANTSYMLLPL